MSRKDDAYPQCEVCYIAENSKWEPESVGDDGSLVSKLIAIAVPLRLSPGSVHACCTCGELTIAGIFTEKDEDEISFNSGPLEEEEIGNDDW
jgi:hypothetical protein